MLVGARRTGNRPQPPGATFVVPRSQRGQYRPGAHEVAGGAEEASQASAGLTRLTEQQRRLINQFKV